MGESHSPTDVHQQNMSTPTPPNQAERHDHAHSSLIFKRLRKERPLPTEKEAKVMFYTLLFVMFLLGWNDASAGPLLPSLQRYYQVDYLVISTIWIASFAGSLTAGLLFVIIVDRFGFGIATPAASLIAVVGYALVSWGGPFPLFVLSYILMGFGIGFQDAQVNTITGRLPNSETKMFYIHAMYGFGATVSPFVATAFVQRVPSRVYLYYCASLGLALLVATLLIIVFRGRTEDQIVGPHTDDIPEGHAMAGMDTPNTQQEGKELPTQQTQDVSPTILEDNIQASDRNDASKNGSGSKMMRIAKTPVVHLIAIYFFIYVGVEVMVGGWATSFLESERGGNDNVGYVSSGYFGGLTVGRIVLIPVTVRMGNHTSILVYTSIVVALSIAIWCTHSIVGNAICFSLMGVFLGPMFPIVINVIVEIVPQELQGGSIGWAGGVGAAGSAMMPFIIGVVSDRYGVWILQPFVVALMSTSMIIWLAILSTSTAKLHRKRLWLKNERLRNGENVIAS